MCEEGVMNPVKGQEAWGKYYNDPRNPTPKHQTLFAALTPPHTTTMQKRHEGVVFEV